MVSRPSATVTVFVPSAHRAVGVVVALTASTFSTLTLHTRPVWTGSPQTTWTWYTPSGRANSQTLPAPDAGRVLNVSYRWSLDRAELRSTAVAVWAAFQPYVSPPAAGP